MLLVDPECVYQSHVSSTKTLSSANQRCPNPERTRARRDNPREPRRHRGAARARRDAPRARAAQLARAVLRRVAIGRREHGGVRSCRIVRLRVRGRRERLRRGAEGHRGLGGVHEHEREARRGDGHDAGVGGRVTGDRLDREVALEAPVDLELPAERLRE